jgi:tetratricopeptide (TPR) repeat protein
MVRSNVYWKLGQYSKAIEFTEQMIECSGSPERANLFKPNLIRLYVSAGQPEKAQEYMKEVVELRKRGQILASDMALASYSLGETDEAIDWFERAYEEHDVWLLDIKSWVCYEQLKEHARIRELIQRIGLPL